MKSHSLNAWMGGWPLCILLAVSVSLIVLLLFSAPTGGVNLEGMVGGGARLNPAVEDLKNQVDLLQTTYDQLTSGVDDQKNRIHGNAQMLLKIMSDTPNQTNDLTHANVNMDDPSKTRIPKVVM